MRRVCAWCNKFMGETCPGEDSADTVSHSICDECADNLDFQLGVTLQRYLDSLKMPVVLVDGSGNVLQANSTAQQCACAVQPGKEWSGKIYECAHARLPERCSHLIHSSGCTIRFAVTETFTTGREITAVPTLQNGCSSSERTRGDYLISTKLEGGIVLLKIEKVA